MTKPALIARLATPAKIAAVTKSDSATLDIATGNVTRHCYALWLDAEGTLNITDLEGSDHDAFPVFAGLNVVAVSKVRTGGSGPSKIYALYPPFD